MKIALRSYLQRGEEVRDDPTEEPGGAVDELAADLAARFRNDSNLIFTNSRGLSETLADKLTNISKVEKWPRNPFRIHHGSISREIREEVESELKEAGKRGLPVTAFCTSTLEMGIDIGAAKAIGQIGPPWSVNSLVQRVGRSGRQEGQCSILRGYALDDQPVPNGEIEKRFFPNLLRFCAIIELTIEGWLEPLDEDDWHLSTCIHQVLSILRQTGGTTVAVLHRQLCESGPFRAIKIPEFLRVLRSLGKLQLIQQMNEGTLILAPDGEKVVEAKEFYAAFQGTEEYSVRCGEDEIGSLPANVVPPVGQHLVLSGRRWRVLDIDSEQNSVFVEHSQGYTKPAFMGSGGFIHNRIAEKMGEILAVAPPMQYLHPDGRKRIESAREEFHRLELNERNFVVSQNGIQWFPWIGTRALLTLVTSAKVAGIEVDSGQFHLTFPSVRESDSLFDLLRGLVEGSFDSVELATHLPVKHFHKFDEWVEPDLLDKVNSERVLDIKAAADAASTLLGQSSIG
ncbi:MAG: helicase-related protein [Verrucomicrobiales bacterium]